MCEFSASIFIATSHSNRHSIVGGGTAGLTIASRLTEGPNISVIVLEAENDPSDDVNVLALGLFVGMYGSPEYDWNYHTVPQVHPFPTTVQTDIDPSPRLRPTTKYSPTHAANNSAAQAQ
jgi:choline dehydrogenase-like flavoprotein